MEMTTANPTSDIKSFSKHFRDNSISINCICGSNHFLPLKKFDRYRIPVEVSMCLECGHIQTRRNLTGEHLDEFYRTHFRTLYTGEAIIPDHIVKENELAAERKMLSLIKANSSDIIKDLIIYEFGASGAWNLFPFKAAGARVQGFDLDQFHIDFAMKRYNIDVRPFNFEVDPDNLEQCDAWICNHVLEHMQDPIGTLMALAKSTRTQGLLYLGLPLLESYKLWGFQRFFHIAHIHYFSLPWIQEVMKQIGFDLLWANAKTGEMLYRKTKEPSYPRTFPKTRLHSLLWYTRMALGYYLKRPEKLLQEKLRTLRRGLPSTKTQSLVKNAAQANQPIIIVASGPSAKDFIPPDGVTVIAVNGAIDWIPRADHWFTLDPSPENMRRMRNQRQGVHYWAAVLPKVNLPKGVTRLRRIDKRTKTPPSSEGPEFWLWRLSCVKGLSKIPDAIHSGNSAWGALGLAYHLGARKVALVGVDATTEPKIEGGPCATDLSHLPLLFASAIGQLDFVSCGKLGGHGIKQLTIEEGMKWLTESSPHK